MVSPTPRPLFTPRKDPVPIVQEVGRAPGLVWTGAVYLAPTGIRSRNVQPGSSGGIATELPGPQFKAVDHPNYILKCICYVT